MATKVKLRQKDLSDDRRSLYLDYYPPIKSTKTDKNTRREFLGLYVYENPKTLIEKQHNKEALQLAEQIRVNRENSINKPEIYTGYEKEQLRIKELGERNFVDYFKHLADQRKTSNHDNWVATYKYLSNFTKGNLRFADLNESFCDGFKNYLLTTKSNKSIKSKLSQNSAFSYFNKLKAGLKQAYKDGFLQTDLNAKTDRIKEAETNRSFLTIEELNKLIKTNCNNPLLKRAFLFSSLTGLRFCDIKKLLWSELEFIEEQGYIIKFTQQKTKGVEVLPISEQAYNLLGEPGDPNNQVFEGLTYSAYSNKYLYQWFGAAGITKDITFHSARHSYATMLLTKGTDLYTVSKMLGHRNIRTTQIYAKIIDKSKRDAADRIVLDFSNKKIL